MAEYPKDKVFVVYCAGPHCNGANKAALRLARLGLPVKTMIGGVTGWIDEGFTLTPSQLSLWPPESTTSQPSTAASKLQEVEPCRGARWVRTVPVLAPMTNLGETLMIEHTGVARRWWAHLCSDVAAKDIVFQSTPHLGQPSLRLNRAPPPLLPRPTPRHGGRISTTDSTPVLHMGSVGNAPFIVMDLLLLAPIAAT
jgi:hypothetical protein